MAYEEEIFSLVKISNGAHRKIGREHNAVWEILKNDNSVLILEK
jgi:hypothetical protein